jgi:GxxExxY protein
MKGKLVEDALSGDIIGAFFEVYRELGFGFLEHVHSTGMQRELSMRGHAVMREFSVRVYYKGEDLCTQRIDMLVDEKIIVEVKSTPALPPTAQRQLRNYLRSTNIEVGLLLHFGPDPKFYREFMSNDSKQRTY